MANETSTLSVTQENNFQGFFKNTDHRKPEYLRTKMLQVINPAIDQVKWDQDSHALFAAHWGDDEARLRSVAAMLYNLKTEVNRHCESSIIVFKRGSPTVLHSDFPILEEALTLETGRVAGSETGIGSLEHHMGNKRNGYGSAHQAVKPPYVHFWTGIKVSHRQSLKIDATGTVRAISPVCEGKEGEVTGYEGLVSLSDEPNAYEQSRQTTTYPIVFGNRAAFNTIKTLAMKTSVRAQLAADSLEQADQFVPTRGLPDLSLIFGQLLNQAEQADPIGQLI